MSNYDHDGNERNGMGGFSSLPDMNNFNSLDQFNAGVSAADNLATARAKMSQHRQNNPVMSNGYSDDDSGKIHSVFDLYSSLFRKVVIPIVIFLSVCLIMNYFFGDKGAEICTGVTIFWLFWFKFVPYIRGKNFD